MTSPLPAGTTLTAARINVPATVKYEVALEGSTTSTSYTTTVTGTTCAGGSFIAPPSGHVLILWSCGLFQTGTGGAVAASAWCSYVVRTGSTLGSGSVIVAAADLAALRQKFSATTNNDQQWGSHDVVTGLTPGNTYNVQLAYKNTDAPATIRMTRQRVIVVPTY